MKLEQRMRNPSKWLGGLCGQLASDLGWSVFWLRLSWVVMTLLSPLWGVGLYVVGSVFYPKLRA
ncbi:PspC domain-containing protein [Shewanella yunxiaonensis]|uniref:PspC domain-containing protein n=1 Tax=Shewanella yunxiaonensis TaxID=2829809 RepID=A0ABX7YRP9_9GAMM|nr:MULTISPECIES: PspC domain-containing protein [Shewanella]MDF0534093.1 PspC domain-containing protein [Shewanella sp. A32]QUN05412.1 PspC domain-containing protein [Shewanella yunxiaonensis]